MGFGRETKPKIRPTKARSYIREAFAKLRLLQDNIPMYTAVENKTDNNPDYVLSSVIRQLLEDALFSLGMSEKELCQLVNDTIPPKEKASVERIQGIMQRNASN